MGKDWKAMAKQWKVRREKATRKVRRERDTRKDWKAMAKPWKVRRERDTRKDWKAMAKPWKVRRERDTRKDWKAMAKPWKVRRERDTRKDWKAMARPWVGANTHCNRNGLSKLLSCHPLASCLLLACFWKKMKLVRLRTALLPKIHVNGPNVPVQSPWLGEPSSASVVSPAPSNQVPFVLRASDRPQSHALLLSASVASMAQPIGGVPFLRMRRLDPLLPAASRRVFFESDNKLVCWE